MKKLLKTYGLNSDMQYFELIVESFINGQRKQANDQFRAMPRGCRKEFIISATTYWSSGLNQNQISELINLI